MATSRQIRQRGRVAKARAFDIDEFEAVETQISSARGELLVLVKKSPHDALSKFKLSVVNGLLMRANELLADDRPIGGFEQFDAETVPSASDTAMVLGQYLAALENLRGKHIKIKSGWWYWIDDDQLTERRTYPPRKLET
jgi:hypothetical protein